MLTSNAHPCVAAKWPKKRHSGHLHQSAVSVERIFVARPVSLTNRVRVSFSMDVPMPNNAYDKADVRYEQAHTGSKARKRGTCVYGSNQNARSLCPKRAARLSIHLAPAGTVSLSLSKKDLFAASSLYVLLAHLTAAFEAIPPIGHGLAINKKTPCWPTRHIRPRTALFY